MPEPVGGSSSSYPWKTPHTEISARYTCSAERTEDFREAARPLYYKIVHEVYQRASQCAVCA